MTAPQIGDRIRATVEGDVLSVDPLGRWAEIGSGQTRFTVPIQSSVDGSLTAESFVVTPPEPTWRQGDIVDVTFEPGEVDRFAVLAGGKAVNLATDGKPFDMADKGWSRWWAEGRMTVVARGA